MLHRATEADLPAIRAFLAPRVATSMFLSGNLRDYGLGTGLGAGLAAEHPKSVTLWYSHAAGEIVNVFGYVKAGFFVFEAPAFSSDLASHLRRALSGRRLRGLNGAASQVEAVVAALELPVAGAALDEVEPHYSVKLADLRLPGGDSQLRSAVLADLALLGAWRMASEVESLGLTDTPENPRPWPRKPAGIADRGSRADP
ncbi:hypothetical protein [Pseudophaeobacter leonis]|uniref:hypothetical protein n=1 Tax=Pseudophaeobacter leonis TaxID=1144477 RepID=UPI0009F46CED|nr:hypothetical protein [Pseudophaeobacter leonis]